ncbi:toll/interleukin-1 receptor domain-containing protein [Piscinibacter koreensis]|uniref:Toll/interleukin-1 receptor domain-containing protein n=1 Tax=Piscinibacter koreensis TaxID=2742824 RepID=A0A7Y6NPV6_9BURK|nr:toll/interleukin-1 receptor domain-containing protein [Schlegelella koreensis]NUZ07148.1 toll/interleukin-1 receptor domain-containing protein [Schlegelella koreensis]
MTARLFISYRASDGADKATALARDLEELYGDEQIFLDKDDLGAGVPWRAEVARTLQARPILLVLVTPDYLGATDAEGRRRIDDPRDPTRIELADALAANAHIVPLMCDGVPAIPASADLPPPFDQLLERTWRRLRAYDWREDFARLVRDLDGLGLERLGAGGGAATAALAAAARRRRLVVGAAGLAVVTAGAGGWLWLRSRQRDLSGRWRVRIGARGATTARTADAMLVDVVHDGATIRFASGPVDIRNDPDWRDYRAFWRQRTGADLTHVLYRADGEVLTQSGEPIGAAVERGALLRVTAALRVLTEAGGEPIDSGSFRGTVEDDDRRIRGRLWLNSEQAERVVELRRDG